MIVLLQFVPTLAISESKAARFAAVLLYILAGVVTALVVSLVLRRGSDMSRLGMIVSGAALIVMPLLGWLKRKRRAV